ncbi:Conserved_hypothetical protein [Hexamita inflata]|uniref:Uncharacterized protein n=1 Tax=Hexamita inflata TaxID=28002 RepID=A0AA86RLZ0_9EUKA|nr:Conserved hypothetical protein [Hexamita inflata]
MAQNLLLNQIIFPVRPRSFEKLFASYKTPCREPTPRIVFQSIIIGDQDPVLFDTLQDTRKRAWESQVSTCKENGAYFELQMPINFNDGQKPNYQNPELKNLQLKDKLRDMQEKIAKKEAEISKIENEVFSQLKILNRDLAIVSQGQNKIKQSKNKLQNSKSFGNIKYTHTLGFVAIILGVVLGYKFR